METMKCRRARRALDQQVKEPATATFVDPAARVTVPEMFPERRFGASFSFIESPMYCLPFRASWSVALPP
jgi:hypothetical protein